MWLVLAAIAAVQFGSGLAVTIFDELGPAATAFARIAIGGAVLVVLVRPRLRGRTRADLGLAALFGLILAGMNTSFYFAIDRIPVGIAVTFEFVGPLTVALATSRRALDVVWVGLAGGGIALLSGGDVHGLDAGGVGFALLAGALWGCYILVSQRVGRAFPGMSGLALALAVGAVATVPAGILDGGALGDLHVLGIAAAVACLSSLIPYTLELEALRHMPSRMFGVLMSLEPAAGALAGLVVLDQRLSGLEGAAIALVIAASAGVTLTAPRATPAPADGPLPVSESRSG